MHQGSIARLKLTGKKVMVLDEVEIDPADYWKQGTGEKGYRVRCEDMSIIIVRAFEVEDTI